MHIAASDTTPALLYGLCVWHQLARVVQARSTIVSNELHSVWAWQTTRVHCLCMELNVHTYVPRRAKAAAVPWRYRCLFCVCTMQQNPSSNLLRRCMICGTSTCTVVRHSTRRPVHQPAWTAPAAPAAPASSVGDSTDWLLLKVNSSCCPLRSRANPFPEENPY